MQIETVTARRVRTAIFFSALLVVAMCPIWAVPYHVTQDGPAHLYAAKVMLGLLSNDPVYSSTYKFNPAPVPNSIGHWITAGMLLVVNQFVAAKVISSLSFAALAGAVAWLWGQYGSSLMAGLLYGFVIAFNWLWLEGFSNFTIGLAFYALTMGLFARWDRVTLSRTTVLAVLAIATFFSHELCFAALAGSLVLLALCRVRNDRGRSLLMIGAALCPGLVLCLLYLILAPDGNRALPMEWSNVPVTLTDWATRIRTSNPFMIVLTRSLPFLDSETACNPMFAPVIWIVGAAGCLLVGSFRKGSQVTRIYGFAALCAVFVVVALIAPDALAGGTLIRPRMSMFAAIAVVPVISMAPKGILRGAATVILAGVFLFQALALWDYSLATSADASDLIAATDGLQEADGIRTITILDRERRYATAPLIHVDGFIPGRKGVIVWDVYEMALPSFPVIAKTAEDRALIDELNYSSVIEPLAGDAADKRARLDRELDQERGLIGAIVIHNGDDELRRSVERWYEPVTDLSRGKTVIYKRRV